MIGADIVHALRDPAVRREVQQALGLPAEPVAEALRELVAAQARTDKTIEKLVAAQARTDKTIEKLVAAQARTDEALKELSCEVKELAAAQARTERGLGLLRQDVGALSDNVGFGLEELAAIVLPAVLAREERVSVGGFTRRFIQTTAGDEEIDLFAEAERDGCPVAVVGESKSRIYDGDVKRFAGRAARVAEALGTKVLPLMFGFVVHPSARRASESLGVLLVASRPGWEG
ncbi:MAG: hypothetical protein HY744_23230 [Deltaproteobacteria bacterium]|nr:hypothetical protein [Deltaproteobacteria bacterium]